MTLNKLVPLVLVISGVVFFATSIYITVKAPNLLATMLAAGIGYLLVSLGVEVYKKECKN